jgi:UDPglucose--hexose-1-phosphate uridylyltransferase
MTWEQRWHPLREEWVIIAAHRQNRPWTGDSIAAHNLYTAAYDPDCYLCPGNTRVSGEKNDTYKGVYVFDNDHPCVSTENEQVSPAPGIYHSSPAYGQAKVICYSPRHDLSLSRVPGAAVSELIECWQEQTSLCAQDERVNHVLLFENRGEVVGVSNPHPHCQLYATNFVFKTIETEAGVSRNYWNENKRPIFQDILKTEKEDGSRILFENDSAIAFIPYFARYAYEVYVAPKETHATVADLSRKECVDLAEVLQHVLIKFDNLWTMPFPYVMPLHQAPLDGKDHSAFHFHIEFHPPLRKPDLLKYLAGPEIGGGNFLSDTSPEEKAAELRACPEQHYMDTTNA